jgi:Rho termination factor, N-terminal domain
MEFTTVLIAVLIVGLLSAMTADIILDMETIWNSLDDDHRGSGRDEKPPTKVADLSWVNLVEDEPEIPEVDVIQLAKSRTKSKPAIQAGVKVRQLLDNLGKQLVDYSALTIRQLKAIAKERGLPKYGSMRKAELVTALSS